MSSKLFFTAVNLKTGFQHSDKA